MESSKDKCDLCGEGTPLFGWVEQLSGLRTVGYRCNNCGCDYGDSMTTYINKLLKKDHDQRMQ